MATGGTRAIVLTGMIAAWLAQLLDAEAACKLAVYLHGMAGGRPALKADEGEVSMTAGATSPATHRRRHSRAHRPAQGGRSHADPRDPQHSSQSSEDENRREPGVSSPRP